MAKATHRATGLNNVSETWEQNEQKRQENRLPNDSNDAGTDVPAASELDRIVHEEAVEYDQQNKDDRLLGGDRASRNDGGE